VVSDNEKPHEGDPFTPEDLRRLDTWTAPAPPPDFTARVMKARAPAAPHRTSTAAPLSRAERERRSRRRSALAALLGAAAVSAGGGFVASQAGVGPAAISAMTIYLAALAFGGVLLIASVVGGHGHADHGGHGHDQDHGADGDMAAHAALVLPFLSLRFWIFGLASSA
jgi:hypothetical protein